MTHLVCEISSQAQKLRRTFGITFDYGGFLNLGTDHISDREHRDMQEYFECKARLFESCKRSVINIGDTYGERLYSMLRDKAEITTFSLNGKNSDFRAGKIRIEDCGCDFKVYQKGKRGGYPIITPSIGAYNAENALCAAVLCNIMGVREDAIMRGIFKARISGRGEIFESADGMSAVMVDYAHNEMSFDAVLRSAKKRFTGAIVTVIFGCPGDKANCRRTGLAGVCARHADKVIVCDDDGGEEGYEKIKHEIRDALLHSISLGGTRLKAENITLIKERKAALEHALMLAAENGQKNVILLLGNGDEEQNRVCGCDVTCVSDIVLAKRAVRDYDVKHSVFERLSTLAGLNGERLLVCLEGGDDMLLPFAQGAAALLGKDVRMCAVCGADEAEVLREYCFKSGISATLHDAQKLNQNEVLAIAGEMKISALPIFSTEKDLFWVLSELVRRIHFDKVVYLVKQTGIIPGEEIDIKTMSLRRAKILDKGIPLKYAFDTFFAGDPGVKELAILDGRSVNSLISYVEGGAYKGTAIKFCHSRRA